MYAWSLITIKCHCNKKNIGPTKGIHCITTYSCSDVQSLTLYASSFYLEIDFRSFIEILYDKYYLIFVCKTININMYSFFTVSIGLTMPEY